MLASRSGQDNPNCRGHVATGRQARLTPILISLLSLLGLTAAAQPQLTTNWSTSILYSGDSSPAVGADGTIYLGTFDHKFWALNPNGTTKYIFKAGSEIFSSPAIGSDSTAYFGCRDRYLYALTPEGKLKWKFHTGAWVDSSPALAEDGSVCFGSWDKCFYCLAPDGSKRWQFETGGVIVSSPAVGNDGTIYFGSHDRRFYALTPGGQKKWSFSTGGQIISSPAIDGDVCLYFTSVDGFLYALNLDGTLRWKLRTGGITQSSPVIGTDGTIFVGVNGEIWAVTAEGKQKWAAGMGGGIIEATPTVFTDNSVCIYSRWGFMFLFDTEHKAKSGFFLGTYGYGSPGVNAEGVLFLFQRWPAFSAFPTGEPLAKTAWPKFRGNPRNTGSLKDRW